MLITGGARSGKSSFAEKLAKDSALPVTYIATSEIKDEEMQERVRFHRQRRPDDWETIEEADNLYYCLEQLVNKRQLILVDCVTVYLSNKLVNYWESWNQEYEDIILSEFKEIGRMIEKKRADVLFVTNEVGLGLVPEYKMGRFFRDLVGRTNQVIAGFSDEVYMVVAGLTKRFK